MRIHGLHEQMGEAVNQRYGKGKLADRKEDGRVQGEKAKKHEFLWKNSQGGRTEGKKTCIATAITGILGGVLNMSYNKWPRQESQKLI